MRRAASSGQESADESEGDCTEEVASNLDVRAAIYIYKMVQIPTAIVVAEDTHDRTEAASYLESVANEYADEGWEFYRVDTIGVRLVPGCMGLLLRWLGYKLPDYLLYYVVTFRRPK